MRRPSPRKRHPLPVSRVTRLLWSIAIGMAFALTVDVLIHGI